MGKRSNFERRDRDFYATPIEAVKPLVPFLKAVDMKFIEPCAGDGALIDAVEAFGPQCVEAGDIEPRDPRVMKADAMELETWGSEADVIITNPPWKRDILHDLILHFATQLPTWLLIDADWVHTKQSARYSPYLRMVVSVGRVQWIPGSGQTGKDNCAWHLFSQPMPMDTVFVGRF